MPVVGAFVLLTAIVVVQQFRIWWLESDNESIMGALVEIRNTLYAIYPKGHS